MYLADPQAAVIRQVNTQGIISTYAGNPSLNPGAGINGPATSFGFASPNGLATDAAGDLYVADNGQGSRTLLKTVAGTGVPGYNGDGISANTAQIDAPLGIATDGAGNVYFAESGGRRVRRIDTQGIIHTIAGVGAALPVGDGGLATSADLISQVGLVSDGKGTFYIADESTSTILTPDGKIATIAGTGLAGYNGDGIPANHAQLNLPFALALDSQGNLSVSDRANNRVRMITAAGIIQTVAGTGVFGYNGDNMAANTAQLATPAGITFDAQGNLYIAEIDNHRLRKVSNGIITTIAGVNAHTSDVPDTDSGDGQSAASANFVFLYGVAVDPAGNIYTADHGSLRVRKIGTDGIIRTFAGQTFTSLGAGTGGDGGFAGNSTLNGATQVAVDAAGDVFISGSDRIREVTPDGIIHTPIGSGTAIAAGQTSPALTDGEFINDSMHLLTGKVQALIGNGLGNIIYAGAAPGSLAGQMQIVAQIPVDSPLKSNVGVLLLIGGQPVTPLLTTIAVQ